MYDAQFSMGHSLLDFCLKEKEKKIEPEETGNEHRIKTRGREGA